MSATEFRAERRPETLPKTKSCTVTIVHRDGRSTTKTHDHAIDGKSMALALQRSRQRRNSETRAERLLKRRERLVDAELKLFGKRK
jgi:hypothetical protein